ncbi:MAG: sugar ABC transporter ATP-binding protein [Azospirillaceae bacterium]
MPFDPPTGDAFLRVEHVSKSFGGVRALDDVGFEVAAGTVHAVMGENGAGKSTLMKILAAVHPHGSYEGRFLLDGRECRFARVLDAEAAGIVMIPQELAVVSELSVAENMFLNAWPGRRGLIDWEGLHDATRRALDDLGLDVAFDAKMKTLSAAQQQMVLIAKALAKNVRLLVLDEPTSSLSVTESDRLFDRLDRLRARGITALYISHKIDEVMAVADAATVLRDGCFVATRQREDLTAGDLVSLMVGRSIEQMYPRVERTPGAVALSVEGLTTHPPHVPETPDTAVLRDIDLAIRHGEILGLYGLVGAGRTELLTTLFGAWPGPVRFRSYAVDGRPVVPTSPAVMMGHGLGLLTEDRKRSGILPGKDIRSNLTLASLDKVSHGLLTSEALEWRRTEGYVRDLAIKTPSVATAIDDLSGGNQQKVLIGRWLSAESRILLLDDPTRGVDVGAKVEIFHLLNRLAGEGAAVCFVTSELPEVLGIADRILVMHEGRIVAELDWREATEESVMRHAAGQGAHRAEGVAP